MKAGSASVVPPKGVSTPEGVDTSAGSDARPKGKWGNLKKKQFPDKNQSHTAITDDQWRQQYLSLVRQTNKAEAVAEMTTAIANTDLDAIHKKFNGYPCKGLLPWMAEEGLTLAKDKPEVAKLLKSILLSEALAHWKKESAAGYLNEGILPHTVYFNKLRNDPLRGSQFEGEEHEKLKKDGGITQNMQKNDKDMQTWLKDTYPALQEAHKVYETNQQSRY